MKRYYDAVAFVILVVAKGLSFPAFEIGLQYFPVLFLAALRFDLASVLIFSYVLTAGVAWKPRTRGDFLAIGTGGLVAITFATAFWSIGQEMTTSTLSGLMASLGPVLTAGFTWLLLPEDRLSPLGLVGLSIGFLGALVIMLPGGGLAFGQGFLGKVLMFLGVAGSALGGVLIRWSKPTMPASSQTAWALLVGAIFLHGSSVVIENPLRESTFSAASIGTVIFLGVVSSGIGRGVFFWLLGRRSAIEISIVSYITPVIAGVTGWILFDDPITTTMIVGFCIVVLGFSVMKRNALGEEMGKLDLSF
jgi:drug/metabolite transporter (DMT)-like permease